MRLAQGAKPEDGSHAVELPAELIHRNRSLIAPLGSRILTFPENVIVGKLKTRTGPDVSGFRDGSVETGAPLQLPTVELQVPNSSKVIVKARAGDDEKVSPTPRAANANAASAIRFMIVTPLDEAPHHRKHIASYADKRRRVKSGPTELAPTQTAPWPWVRAGVASRLNYAPDRRYW